MASTQPEDPFSGWLREDGGPWRRVVTGDDPGATLSRLLAVKVTGKNVERIVLSAGRSPNQGRQTR